ncbi:hypothetical protein Lal_00024521 [Lupinus albus]|nr:hypothetical protein Lal_00024521 [Lupinus albus]
MGTTINDSILYRGKVIIFGGDSIQILLVVPRVCLGKLFKPNDSCDEVDISEKLLILDFDNLINDIVSNTYPSLQRHYNDEHFCNIDQYLHQQLRLLIKSMNMF